MCTLYTILVISYFSSVTYFYFCYRTIHHFIVIILTEFHFKTLDLCWNVHRDRLLAGTLYWKKCSVVYAFNLYSCIVCVYEVYYSNTNNGYGNDLPAYVLSRKFPDEKHELNNSTNSGLAYRQGKLYIVQQIYVCASS